MTRKRIRSFSRISATQPPKASERGLALLRQVAHMTHAMVFVRMGSGGKPSELQCQRPRSSRPRATAAAPAKSVLTTDDAKLQYANVRMNRRLHSVARHVFNTLPRVVALGLGGLPRENG